jgi:hypothetical protein
VRSKFLLRLGSPCFTGPVIRMAASLTWILWFESGFLSPSTSQPPKSASYAMKCGSQVIYPCWIPNCKLNAFYSEYMIRFTVLLIHSMQISGCLIPNCTCLCIRSV